MLVQRTLPFRTNDTAAGKVLERLRRIALAWLNRNQFRMRIVLAFQTRGQQCRLFCTHGPSGVVIERAVNADGQHVTICEFDCCEVLSDVTERMFDE